MAQHASVSVVVPVFNAERHLEEALASVKNQDYPVLEVIAVDDGSTDGSAVLLSAHHGVRVGRQANSGPAAARNLGISLAQGDFLAFLDADDVWLSDKLTCQIGVFEEHPEVDVVFGHVEEFCAGEVSEATRRAHSRTVPGYLPSTLMARRSVFEEAGVFDAGLRAAELLEWLDRCRTAQLSIRMMDQVVARRRVHGSNTFQRDPDARREMVRAVHAVLRRRRGEADGDQNRGRSPFRSGMLVDSGSGD